MKTLSGTLRFQVEFEQKPEQEIQLAGFLFYCNGILIQKQFVKDNVLEFSFNDDVKRVVKAGDAERTRLTAEGDLPDASQLRLFIAPVANRNIENINTIEAMESLKAYEPVLNSDVEGNISILPIPVIISQFWPFCICRVTGKVSKWFHVGQTWQNRVVCHARVHICEVDKIWYWIYRIPDNIIAKIPDIILRPEEVIKIPIPIPDPPPFFNRAVQPKIEPTQNIFSNASAENIQPDTISKLPVLSDDIKRSFASGNLNAIRETIAANYSILHPWFCLSPILWPYFYRCDEAAVVYTDANGRFDTNIIYSCFGDRPDIYIWVEYLINGVWTSVYHPPIPCYTFWDYTCGSNINITITDERVPGNCCCNCPIPGELVWIRSVGGHTSVAHIQQNAVLQAPDGQLASYDRIGLTDADAIGDTFTTHVGDFKRPFGGRPSLYMGFGSDLPNTNIYYYRWSYKQIKNADLDDPATADDYKPLVPAGGFVSKSYQYLYIDPADSSTQSAPDSVTLGPLTVGSNSNLYIIPPSSPDMAPFNVLAAHPERFSPGWHEPIYNMNTISFDSSQLKNGAMPGGDGLYEFKLELFDEAGNLLTHIPKSTFKVPDYLDAGFSVNAPDQLLDTNIIDDTANAFNIQMRIDNSKCHGGIFPVQVNGHDASLDCCGFVSYKPEGAEADIKLSFLATHPNNFGVFSFSVVRGTCGNVTNAGAGGMVIDSTYQSLSPVVYAYQLNSSGVYEKHFTPAQLLEGCYDNGNGKAAFAETLYVTAMATDGVFRVSANDAVHELLAYPVAAFALEP